MASSFLMFLDHTQRRTTVGRTHLDEWSARRRDLYLTTRNNHNRQTSMPPVGFELTISASERQHTCSLDRAVTGKCTGSFLRVQMNTVTSVTGQFKRVTAVREVVDVLNISVYVLSLGSPRHPMFVKPCLYQDNEQAGWSHDIFGLSSVGAWLNSDPGCYLPCGSSRFSSVPPNTCRDTEK